MENSSIRIEAIPNYIAVIIVPAILFFVFINTNDNDQRNLRFAIFCGIFILSYIPSLIYKLNIKQPYPSEALLTRSWRGIALIYILLSIWNYNFVSHIEATGYTSDIFRDKFWKYYAPYYGIPENYTISDFVLILVPGVTFFLIIYRLVNRAKPVNNITILAISLLFYLIFISVFALTESNTRLFGDVYDYSHLGISSNLNKFTGLYDIFSNWTKYMTDLSGRSSHYPPGNLIIMRYEHIWDLIGLYKLIIITLTTAAIILLYYLALMVGLKKNIAIIAPILFMLSPCVIIQPSTATSPLAMVLGLATHVLLIRGIMLDSKPTIIASSTIFFIYSLFSFVMFVSFLLMGFVLFFACYFGAISVKRTLSGMFYFSTTFLLLHSLLYLTTGFNIIDCLSISIANNNELITKEGPFENIARYMLRSSGNLLAYIGFSGAIIASLAYIVITSVKSYSPLLKAHAIGLAFGLMATSFSTLFYMETERIWIFFTPILCLVAAAAFHREKNLSSAPVFFILVGLYLSSLMQETIFLHYLWIASYLPS